MWKYEGMTPKQRDALVHFLGIADFVVDGGRILPKTIPTGYDYNTFGEHPIPIGALYDQPNDICLVLNEPISPATWTCWHRVRSICDRI